MTPCNRGLSGGMRWEFLIIDNCSTDDTLDVARSVENDFPDQVRVLQETELGLSAARNTGVRNAKGDFIAFLDDDAFPARGWLQAIIDALLIDGIQCAGGPIEPVFQGELPDWFLGRFLPYLSVWDLGDSARRLHYDEYPRGANVAFRREVFDSVGGFCTDLGRKGNNLLSCEEIELCLRIERLGGEIAYVPEARVRHKVNIERLSPEWLKKRFEAQGRSEAVINWRHGGLIGLMKGRRTISKRVREASSQSNHGDDLIVRCQRRSLRGYMRAVLPTVFTVDRWRWPAETTAKAWLPMT